LVLITHDHFDHMDAKALALVRTSKTVVMAPAAVAASINGVTVLANGDSRDFGAWKIEAVPAYNLVRGPAAGQLFHPKGRGNGYVLTYCGKRFYFSGDTEGVPEMLALKNIDVAFICINLPYTMPPEEAANAVRAFHPAVECGEAICVALSNVVPERSSPQVYKLGMPNAVIGFKNGVMWMDQGVDVRASDASETQGVDGWGSMCSGLGNLMLAEAEDAESRFPVLNLGREMTIDTGGAGRWRGQPGTRNIKKVLEPTMAVTWMVSMKHPLRGLCGGDDAGPYSNYFEVGTAKEYKIENSVQAQLPAGAVIAYQYGGGAGFESALSCPHPSQHKENA